MNKKFTIASLNKLAKPSGLKLIQGNGYLYWATLESTKHLQEPKSISVCRFSQEGKDFWLNELESAVLHIEEMEMEHTDFENFKEWTKVKKYQQTKPTNSNFIIL